MTKIAAAVIASVLSFLLGVALAALLGLHRPLHVLLPAIVLAAVTCSIALRVVGKLHTPPTLQTRAATTAILCAAMVASIILLFKAIY